MQAEALDESLEEIKKHLMEVNTSYLRSEELLETYHASVNMISEEDEDERSLWAKKLDKYAARLERQQTIIEKGTRENEEWKASLQAGLQEFEGEWGFVPAKLLPPLKILLAC